MSDGIKFFSLFFLSVFIFITSLVWTKRSLKINKIPAFHFWRTLTILSAFFVLYLLITFIILMFIWEPAVIDLH